MFENEVYGRRVLRSTIGINIICLLMLVFYVFHVISLELLHEDDKSMSATTYYYPWWPLLWTIVFVLVITLITIQLTLDVDMMLFRSELDENGERLTKRVELWTKVSSGFLIVCTLSFSLSLFSEGRENPGVIFLLGFGGLIFRLVLLYMAYQYLAYLKGIRLPLHSSTPVLTVPTSTYRTYLSDPTPPIAGPSFV